MNLRGGIVILSEQRKRRRSRTTNKCKEDWCWDGVW